MEQVATRVLILLLPKGRNRRASPFVCPWSVGPHLVTTPQESTCIGLAVCTPHTPPIHPAGFGPPRSFAGPIAGTTGWQGSKPTRNPGTGALPSKRGRRRRNRDVERLHTVRCR